MSHQHATPPGRDPWGDPAPDPKATRKSCLVKGLIAAAVAVVVVMFLAVSCAGGAMIASTPTDGDAAAPMPAAETSAATPAAAAPEDGTWTAGEDFPAGTWQSKGVPTGDLEIGCSWTITRDGDVADFGFTEAGRPKFTVKEGDEVQIHGCGTWELVG